MIHNRDKILGVSVLVVWGYCFISAVLHQKNAAPWAAATCTSLDTGHQLFRQQQTSLVLFFGTTGTSGRHSCLPLALASNNWHAKEIYMHIGAGREWE
jgi:hypothetical protein